MGGADWLEVVMLVSICPVLFLCTSLPQSEEVSS